MKTVSVGGNQFAVYDRGAGRPVLLVHGFPFDHQMWQDQVDELATSCRVIAPDLRGFGKSGISTDTVTMDQYADDLNLVLDAVDVREPVVFCGFSMGGYVAWQFLRK
jgi:pimeloyl-ACP methyl ester carboxylesterase